MTPPGNWLDPSPQSPAERLAQCVPAEHDFHDFLLACSKVYALANYTGVSLLARD